MKAVRIHRFGGPDVLQIEDIPTPEPKADELLVRVLTASVNPVDYKIRLGKFPPVKEDQLPITMGRDLCGVIEKCSGAGTFKTGDEIIAMLGPDRGAYAEFAIVKANEAALKPGLPNHAEAGAVPLAALTAWQGLFDHGGLREGQTVLIHGGAGGVGHFAIQFAKAKGAYVATTASADDIEFVSQLGADQAIDFRNKKFEDIARDVDLVYDLIGGETQEQSFAVLKRGGTLISTVQEPDKDKLAQYGLQGSRYGAQPSGEQLETIGGLMSDGTVKSIVAKVYALADAAQAQQELEAGHIRGKIVLECSPA